MDRSIGIAKEVLEIESYAVKAQIENLNTDFSKAVNEISKLEGRLICTGVGKSGLIMQKVAATFSSTGTPAIFLHPSEAIHGDLGIVQEEDIVLAASYSGNTQEIVTLIPFLKRIGVKIIAITANRDSALAKHCDFLIPISIDTEACPLNLAPTASTTATLALGDALAMAVMHKRNFTREDFAKLHPGGNIGKKLMKIEELMHTGEKIPKVTENTTMRETIYEMSRKGFGVTAVTDENDTLLGVITDGDLRRLLEREENPLSIPAKNVMTKHPKTINPEELASVALKKMEKHKITSLLVTNEEKKLIGIVHIHDLWRLELF